MKVILLLCLAVLALGALSASIDNSQWDNHYIFRNMARLDWRVDVPKRIIYLRFEAHNPGWIGIGWSPADGKMQNADMVIMTRKNGEYVIGDYFAQGFVTPVLDDHQDITMRGGGQDDGTTWMEFSRPFETVDNFDKPITQGSMRIIWALGRAIDSLEIHSEKGADDVILWPMIPGDYETTQNAFLTSEESAVEVRNITVASNATQPTQTQPTQTQPTQTQPTQTQPTQTQPTQTQPTQTQPTQTQPTQTQPAQGATQTATQGHAGTEQPDFDQWVEKIRNGDLDDGFDPVHGPSRASGGEAGAASQQEDIQSLADQDLIDHKLQGQQDNRNDDAKHAMKDDRLTNDEINRNLVKVSQNTIQAPPGGFNAPNLPAIPVIPLTYPVAGNKILPGPIYTGYPMAELYTNYYNALASIYSLYGYPNANYYANPNVVYPSYSYANQIQQPYQANQQVYQQSNQLYANQQQNRDYVQNGANGNYGGARTPVRKQIKDTGANTQLQNPKYRSETSRGRPSLGGAGRSRPVRRR